MSMGGKRAGAGRPKTNIDDKRVLVLLGQGFSRREIAERFGVSIGVIQYSVRFNKGKT
jgi:transposase